MTETSLERALGQVEGQLKALVEQAAESETASREGRAALYGVVNEVRVTLGAVQSEIKTLDKRVQAIEPVVSEFSNWRQRGVGALMVLSVLTAGTGAVVASMWDKILHAIGWK